MRIKNSVVVIEAGKEADNPFESCLPLVELKQIGWQRTQKNQITFSRCT